MINMKKEKTIKNKEIQGRNKKFKKQHELKLKN